MVAQAEASAAKLDHMGPEDTIVQKVHLPLIHSIVERQRANSRNAAELLAQAEPYEFTLDVPYRRALAYLAAGEPAKAAAGFEKLIDDRGAGWWAVYAPLTKLGLARAYTGLEEREKSLKAYNDFSTTWKDADPDIPILRQAKAEYKKLTAAAPAAVSASGAQQ